MAQKFADIGFKLTDTEFFHEFVTESEKSSDSVLKALEERGILGGLPLY